MVASCLCGRVNVTVDAKPEYIHDCSCSLCRKVGAAWGYFAAAAVTVAGETKGFVRRDKEAAGTRVCTCEHCGTTTHFELTEAFRRQNPAADLIGVNMRIFDPDDLDGVEVRYPDGKNWSGSGAFDYRRAPLTIGDGVRW